MSRQWQISSAELFELIRPAVWALSAILSTCVFSSARHYKFRSYAVAAFTLGTLFFPLVVLPLYLIVRARTRSRRIHAQQQTTGQAMPEAETHPGTFAAPTAWKRIWPALYLTAVLSIIAFIFYQDYWSVDAHLWRANNAKLRGPHEKVITEYQEALAIADDPHTRKLLAIELAAAGRAEEALAEFRVAERGGEPDHRIPYYAGMALDALGRERDAALEYKRFVNGPACTQTPPDVKCAAARARIEATTHPASNSK